MASIVAVLLLLAAVAFAKLRQARVPEGERQLHSRARAEQRIAATLEGLEPDGWHLMHDRVLPGGEHRVPLLLVGPAGVVIVTAAPAAKALVLRGRELWASNLPLTPWFATRWWEAEHLARVLTEHLGPQWRPVVTPIVLASSTPVGLTQWGRVAVREPGAAPTVVATMASPWSRAQAAYVASVVDALCAPA